MFLFYNRRLPLTNTNGCINGHQFEQANFGNKKIVLAPRSVLTLFLTLVNHRHHRLLHPDRHEHRCPAELGVRE